MELVFMALIAVTFLSSSIAILVLNLKLRSRIMLKNKDENIEKDVHSDIFNISRSINSGYAYTVDAGDSLVVVVVVNKNNVGSSFLNILPNPIEMSSENYGGE